MNTVDPGPAGSDPLGLARALRNLPAVAALPPDAFTDLHRRCLDTLAIRLAARLTAGLDGAQLNEYSAAALYQGTHPGTGEHTRAWIGANLPDHHAALATELDRILHETAHTLATGPAPPPETPCPPAG